MSFICSIIRFCCPCLFSKKTRIKKKSKSPKKTIKTTTTVTDDWMRQTSKLSPEQIPDNKLTKVYTVPNTEKGYMTVEECIKEQGFIVDFSQANRLGDSGQVYRAMSKDNGMKVACKRIQLSNDSKILVDEEFRRLKDELYLLAHCKRHENIIQMITNFIVTDVDRQQQYCYIFMELANGGTLANKVAIDWRPGREKVVPMSESLAKFYFKQIVEGINFLHTSKVAHKDLKLSNILISIREDKREVVKITDFGLSGIRFDYDEKRVIKEVWWYGTIYYMPPQVFKLYIWDRYKIKVGELIKVNAYQADIWSLGICLYAMICGSYPFGISKNFIRPSFGEELESHLHVYVYNCMKDRNYTICEDIKKKISSDCTDLIDQMLEPNPQSRVTIQSILYHKWLRN